MAVQVPSEPKPQASRPNRVMDVDIKGACCFQLQARDELDNQTVGTEKDVNVEFVDEVEQQDVALPGDDSELYAKIYSPDLDLKTFLSRPTRIISTTIAQGASFAVTRYDPWSLFLNNTAIKNKLENYRYLRGTLKINVLVNSTPFVYGLYALSYCPLPGVGLYDISGDQREVSNAITTYTQRPTIFIKPHTNEGGEMTLPYIYPKNFIEIQGTERTALGALDLYPIVSLAAASATSQGCSINVYAWMEDVVLAAPTMALQAKDEYLLGPVSYPASVVAGIGKRLTDIPVIGKFARATELGANAVARIAALFGFSKVPVITSSAPSRIMFSRGMASGTIADVHEKLALDPKNELTVDTRAPGFAGGDELNVAQLCARSCVLTTAAWAQSDAADFVLFSANVTPTMAGSTVSTKYNVLYDTPMANVSRMFRDWRGDIIYTLQLVASSYHQGRLIVTFDPAGGTASAGSENTLVTKIWDIQQCDKISFKVPFVSATNWKNCSSAMSQDYSVRGATAITFNNLYHVGRLTVRVGNALVGPISSANATIVVHTHMENGEYANPITTSHRFSAMPLQSKEEHFEMAPGVTQDDNSYLVNMGERIQTLRTLMQRENFYRRDCIQCAAGYNSVTVQNSHYPGYFGYQPNGSTGQMDQAVSTLATGNKLFWWVNEGPIQWMSACFIGMRGSMKWRVISLPNSANTQDYRLSIGRCPWDYTLATSNARVRNYAYALTNTAGQLAADAVTTQEFGTSANAPFPTDSGITMSSSRVNPSVVAEIPLFSQYNFLYSGYANIGASGNPNRDTYWYYNYTAPQNAAGVNTFETYCSAGTDFTMAGFVNVPPRYYFTTVPTPV
jgi:hypothetical protein